MMEKTLRWACGVIAGAVNPARGGLVSGIGSAVWSGIKNAAK
jgi:hypothetical protein